MLRSPSRRRVARWTTAAYVTLSVSDAVLASSRGREAPGLRGVTKPLLMPSLSAALLASLPPVPQPDTAVLRGGTLAAQVLSGVGDVALLRRGPRSFLAGLTAFLAAHGAYTVGFLSMRSAGTAWRNSRREPRRVWLLPAVPAALTGAVLAPDGLRPAAGAYAAALAVMVGASARVDKRVRVSVRRRLVAGTSLFVVSDTLLVVRDFLVEEPPPWLGGAVMLSYTGAQGLIASAVRDASRIGREAECQHHVAHG